MNIQRSLIKFIIIYISREFLKREKKKTHLSLSHQVITNVDEEDV
jgi:hypothetical protein